MGCCDVSHAGLRVLAALFWLTGSVICGTVSMLTALGPVPPDAKAVLGIYPSCRGCEDLPRWNYVRWVVAIGGVLLGLLKGWCLVWKMFARREVERIHALTEPKAYHFFPKWRLLVLCLICPTCVQVQLRTAQFVISALVFIGLLANVCVFLAFGALRILTGEGLAEHPPSSVITREDYRRSTLLQSGGYQYVSAPMH